MRIDTNYEGPNLDDVEDGTVKDYLQNDKAARAEWQRNLVIQIEKMLSKNSAVVLIPRTTIDLGSSALAGTAAVMVASFNAMALPTVHQTTTNNPEFALNYTGRGILQRVIGMSQSAAGTSTSAGFLMRITIDDVPVYGTSGGLTAPTALNNRMLAMVGSLFRAESPVLTPDILYGSMDDVPGLPFNKNCKIEIQVGSAGQPVRCGWRVQKRL